MISILLVEDDLHITQGIAEYLMPLGYELDFAYNGQQALVHLGGQAYDLVILDINLPKINGFEVLKFLRQDELSSIPVIITTARGENEDVLLGFDLGAWDYLIKPFSFSELAARIKVNLSKYRIVTKSIYEFDGLILDENSLVLEFKSNQIQLHNVGYLILKALVQSAPNTLSKTVLEETVWGSSKPNSDPLRAHIYRLRKQFMAKFGKPLIKTVKGVGYYLDVKN